MSLILIKGLGQSGSILVKGLLGALGEPSVFVRQGFLDRFPINQMFGRKALHNSGFIHAPGVKK